MYGQQIIYHWSTVIKLPHAEFDIASVIYILTEWKLMGWKSHEGESQIF